jgi:hypothetical protein
MQDLLPGQGDVVVEFSAMDGPYAPVWNGTSRKPQ